MGLSRSYSEPLLGNLQETRNNTGRLSFRESREGQHPLIRHGSGLLEYIGTQSPAFNSLRQSYILLNAYNIFEEGVHIDSSKCPICEEALTQENGLALECGHSFCCSCLNEYMILRITEGKVMTVPCPVHTCRKGVSDDIVGRLVSPELLSKFMYFKERNQLTSNPRLRWCPRPDCQGYDLGSKNKKHLKCSACQYEYCYYCGEAWHWKKKCKNSSERKLDKWASSRNVKFCPNCRLRVEKDLGCNHMSCTQCSYEWCWLCGWEYNPNHFNECPVMKQRYTNPPMSYVFCLLLAPILFPFTPFVLYMLINVLENIEDEIAEQLEGRCFGRLVRTRWMLFYPLFILSSPLMTAVAVVCLVLFGGFMLIFQCNICSNWTNSKPMRCLLEFILGAILGPLLLAGVILCYALFSIAGFILIVLKLVILVVRLYRPEFMRPKLAPGYD
mmetsp:Transcript_13200/g.24715  ORF Transcript_13200/g.24715 Transcript_13200/m.24715 type:complete len:443 (-) Transcript_13200:4430-5758(-)